MRPLLTLLSMALVAAIAHQAPASAQPYPARPVRLVVPTGAGGGLDLVARHLGQKLSELWGKGVVVENKVGEIGRAHV